MDFFTVFKWNWLVKLTFIHQYKPRRTSQSYHFIYRIKINRKIIVNLKFYNSVHMITDDFIRVNENCICIWSLFSIALHTHSRICVEIKELSF